MADAPALRRLGPLVAEVPVAVTPLPSTTRFSVRGGAIAAARLGAAFGVELPQQALRAATAGDRAALWLGPDEWLLLAPVADGLRPADLESRLEGEPGCVVDVSHRQIGLTLDGPGGGPALNAGCPLDLDPSVFPVGTCTRTVLGKAEVTLWRREPERFHLECWRSFAPYVFALLDQAIRDLAN